MGLLDDAIREHLELKRLRGADPGEVAREQREALDPVPRDGDRESDAVEDVAPGAIQEMAPVGGPPAQDHPPTRSTSDVDNPDDSRETAELDMRTLLHEDQGTPDADTAPAGDAAGGSVGDASGESGGEDSLEWEVPGDSAKELATHGGHHEHTRVDEGPAGTVVEWDLAPGQAEDSLQQPRDRLPETPEQERLRFDQRSPGDSDHEK